MPGISGIDLAIKMRAQYPTCSVLLFSGQPASLALVDDARSQGHDFRLLLKPVLPVDFLSEIGRMVDAVDPVSSHGTTLPPPHGSSGASKHRGQSDQL